MVAGGALNEATRTTTARRSLGIGCCCELATQRTVSEAMAVDTISMLCAGVSEASKIGIAQEQRVNTATQSGGRAPSLVCHESLARRARRGAHGAGAHGAAGPCSLPVDPAARGICTRMNDSTCRPKELFSMKQHREPETEHAAPSPERRRRQRTRGPTSAMLSTSSARLTMRGLTLLLCLLACLSASSRASQWDPHPPGAEPSWFEAS